MHPNVSVEIHFHRLERQWLLSPEPVGVNDKAIQLYLFDCDQLHDLPQHACSGLSADEWQRAARFRFDRDRHRFILVRSVLRRLLAHCLDISPGKMRLTCNAWGKPLLCGMQDGEGLAFNVSHTQGLACIALALGCRIGVDVERIRPVCEYAEIAQSFFTARESAAIESCVTAEQQAFFFSLWSRKEAFLKATGQGLSRSLASFDVPPVVALPPLGVHQAVHVYAAPLSRPMLVSFTPEPGVAGALAVIGGARY
ncbi:MAG: 4'-phosphopantetheinyl transferase superfamily protein [Desulfobulbus sp.]|uniref:4'-phosphopantetheinyl transferase family protein n=1 Tax=Desulfobulbus sp. TaxID=895 RepID=UPI002848194C|nr:4'-phosphopantetheinyl transferase superfamily protein [Desulfobulbus sp.]MDR2549252.1 4'-phosphopantetheinyl transferase superfamily protein [Desulfobulbus sp.]